MKSKVTVIIPTYNNLRWLPEAVDSAIAQTYPECDIVIVDDGSTDGTNEWAEKSLADHVTYLRKPNGGLASARNYAIERTDGDYIQFLDADDTIAAEKVATHVEQLDAHPEYAAVYGPSAYFFADEPARVMEWRPDAKRPSGKVFKEMLDEPFILTHAILTRRQWINKTGPFNEALNSVIDGEYWIRMAKLDAHIQYLPGKAQSFYRIREGSQSSDSVQMRGTMLHILRDVKRQLPDKSERRAIKINRAIGKWQATYGFALMSSGEGRKGWWQLLTSLRGDQRHAGSRVVRLILVPIFGWSKSQSLIDAGKNLLKSVTRLIRA